MVTPQHAKIHAGAHAVGGTDALALIPAQADQTEAEAESNVDKYLPPDLLHFGPWAAKAWCTVITDGTLGSPSYNITSSGKDSTGIYTITIANDMSGTVYPADATIRTNLSHSIAVSDFAAGTYKVRGFNTDAQAAVDINFTTKVHGDL